MVTTNYYKELELTVFIPKANYQQSLNAIDKNNKNSKGNLNQLEQQVPLDNNNQGASKVDLLILLEQPVDKNLEQLAHKVIASISMVNKNIRYQTEYLTSNIFYSPDSDGSVLSVQDIKYRGGEFKKALIMGVDSLDFLGVVNIKKVISDYNINSKLEQEDILIAPSLKQLSTDANAKKLLWQQLKKFLVF